MTFVGKTVIYKAFVASGHVLWLGRGWNVLAHVHAAGTLQCTFCTEVAALTGQFVGCCQSSQQHSPTSGC